MTALWSAQGIPEFVGSPDADLGPVAGDDAMALLPVVPSMQRVEALYPVTEQLANGVRLDLLPGLAEGGSGDGPLRRQREAERPALVPEGVEKGLIAAAAGVGDEVEEQSDEEFGREWAASREVVLTTPERSGLRAGKKAGD